MEVSTFLIGLSLVLIPTGILSIIGYFFLYKVPEGYALVTRRGAKPIESNRWQFGLTFHTAKLVSISKTIANIDSIQLHTLDDGILTVNVNLAYSPAMHSNDALIQFQQTSDHTRILTARVQSGLNSWIRQKPLPGTLRRAMTMQKEAEEYLFSFITGLSNEALVLRLDALITRQSGELVNDLGIVLHEVNITDMQETKRGNGKPDWGDDDLIFDAKKARRRLQQKVSNIRDLRQEKEALIIEFPEEAEEIEEMYDDERIRAKEHRDR